MNGQAGSGGPGGGDDLGLADVAWRLRSSLSGAEELPVPVDDDILAGIRRRSSRRRRAKRAMGTTMAVFALSMTTLAVINGGPIDDGTDLAGNVEPPPAVTPGGAQGRPPRGADGSTLQPGARGQNPEWVDTGDCRDGRDRDGRPCSPGDGMRPGGGPTISPPAGCASGLPGADGICPDGTPVPTDPAGPNATSRTTNRNPGDPNGPVGPSGPTTPPPTGTPPTVPATTVPTTVPRPIDCGRVGPGEAPADPGCLVAALADGRRARFSAMGEGVGTPAGGTTVHFEVLTNQSVKIERFVEGPDGRTVTIQQCSSLSAVGTFPWYEPGDTCVNATPQVADNPPGPS